MRPRAESPNYTLALRYLSKPMTTVQLAQRLGIAVRNARAYVQLLHKEKKIYVHAWLPKRCAVYMAGDEPNAPYQGAVSAQERARRTRTKAQIASGGWAWMLPTRKGK